MDDPKDIYQEKLDELTGGDREPTDAECALAHDLMVDHFADLGVRIRDRIKDGDL